MIESGYLGPYILGPTSNCKRGVYTGSAAQLGVVVPSHSVDLIFCDPVYDNMEQYDWLGFFASRVLADGGSLIVQCGNIYRFEAETQIHRYQALEHRILLLERLTGGHSQLWRDRAIIGVKPYLWFTKNMGAMRKSKSWVPNLVDGGGSSKKHHRWGDSSKAIEVWISRLTEPGAIVLDPFAGSGTVSMACIRTGRQYLAFEIMPDVADRARKNCVYAQPSLIHANRQLEFL